MSQLLNAHIRALYLKYNARLWGLSDVVEANKRHKNTYKAANDCLIIVKEKVVQERRAAMEEWDVMRAALNKVA